MSVIKSVLIVDSNPDDTTLMQMALRELTVESPILLVGEGAEAIRYLLGVGKYAERPRYPFPALVLLELKLPGVSGYEVLSWLHDHAQVKAGLAVVVNTSLLTPETAQTAKALGADEVLEKPLGYEQLKTQLRGLKERWLDAKPGGASDI